MFNSLRVIRWKALFIKEFYQIIRDPSTILISIVLPAILLFMYGYGLSLDWDHLRIGIVMEDTAPDAQSFVESITNSPYFEAKIARDRRELIDPLLRGDIRGIVIIPSYFSAFRNNPNTIAPIQVIADGSETNTANFVQNYVTGAWQNWLNQEEISNGLKGLPLIQVQPRYWYNEELRSRDFLVPGSLSIIMTLIGVLLTSLVIAREWERGTMEAMMSTPIEIIDIVIGKLVPYFVLGMLSTNICVIGTIWIYHVPLRGSWLVLQLVSAIFLIPSLGLGLLISTITRNQFVSSQIAVIIGFLPAYMLSGFIFEITSMPMVIQWLTYLVPARYFVTILQTLFLVGNIWPLILMNIIPLIVYGIIVFYFITRVTVKRLD